MTTMTVLTGVRLPAAQTGHRRLRLTWLRELALLAMVYAAYMLTRAQISLEPAAAREHGRWLLELEAALGLDAEHALNAWLHTVPMAAVASAYLYASLHYLLTPAALVWLAWRHGDRYASSRNVLLVATALGVLGFWLLPTAPPRLLETGFLDTMALTSGSGWWGEAASAPRGMEGLSNQYAAMPSLHVGWAVWVALVVHRFSGHRRLAAWAWAYPAVTTFVVVATANHYVVDALAGAAVVLVADIVVRHVGRQGGRSTR